MSKIKLFTHTDLDGIGCAVLAYLAFGAENVDVEYCDYKDVDEKVRRFGESEEYKSYDKVYITDISVSENLAASMNTALVSDKLMLLDHHATAEHLNKYIWANVRVTSPSTGDKTSGTKLFYQHLLLEGRFDKYSDRVLYNIRDFAQAVCDYDTWRWKEVLSEEEGIVCKQLNDLFHIYGREEFIDWAEDAISAYDSFPEFGLVEKTLLEQKQKDIDIYVETKSKQVMTVVDNFGYTCGVVFAERYFSEFGNRLSEMRPGLDYIAMIDISKGTVSYRTIHDGIDLGGEIAHSFGGGGHRKAAGSSFDACEMRGIVLNELFGLSLGTSHIWYQD